MNDIILGQNVKMLFMYSERLVYSAQYTIGRLCPLKEFI